MPGIILHIRIRIRYDLPILSDSEFFGRIHISYPIFHDLAKIRKMPWQWYFVFLSSLKDPYRAKRLKNKENVCWWHEKLFFSENRRSGSTFKMIQICVHIIRIRFKKHGIHTTLPINIHSCLGCSIVIK